MLPQRGKAVQLFAIALTVTNYLLTVGMVCIAVAVSMGRRMPDSILILPLTNILALPQLRAAMPDAPDFGESTSLIPQCGFTKRGLDRHIPGHILLWSKPPRGALRSSHGFNTRRASLLTNIMAGGVCGHVHYD